MGYSTDIEGELKFTSELTMPQLQRISKMLGENPREHPDWEKYGIKADSYIQWELTKDYSGIKWDGNEKFYCIVESVNLILAYMREEFPNFGMQGELLCQGEEIRDRWNLVIENGQAISRKIDLGASYQCPHCREDFLLSEAKQVA